MVSPSGLRLVQTNQIELARGLLLLLRKIDRLPPAAGQALVTITAPKYADQIVEQPQMIE